MSQSGKKWKSTSIPEDLYDRIKETVESKAGDYKNPTDFIIDAIRRRLEELEKIQMVGEEYNLSEEEVKRMAKLEHTNIAVNGGKTVIAITDHTDGRIYDVIVSKKGNRLHLFCMGDQSFDCVHVKYVFHVIIPKLNEYIRKYRKKEE